jgi:hypothetical protein
MASQASVLDSLAAVKMAKAEAECVKTNANLWEKAAKKPEQPTSWGNMVREYKVHSSRRKWPFRAPF